MRRAPNMGSVLYFRTACQGFCEHFHRCAGVRRDPRAVAYTAAVADAQQSPSSESAPAGRGARLRRARQERGLSLRELSRRLNVSPGHISQIERDIVAPSISLLYSIVSELGMSMDALFDVPAQLEGHVRGDGGMPSGDRDIPRTKGESRYVRRFNERQTIDIGAGVRWELLTPTTDAGVDFREIVYTSTSPDGEHEAFIRHAGHECGLVLEGRLHVQVEFDTFVLGPGDSIAFESAKPHKFWNQGPGPVRTVWVSNVSS